MSADSEALEKLARRALSGKDAHVEIRDVFSGLILRISSSAGGGTDSSG